ncbi:hypothetical protein BUE76_01495 [Cnuella takakiae]|nr:hypothetical protein BUE76_01495 [Cnuella takakiae]
MLVQRKDVKGRGEKVCKLVGQAILLFQWQWKGQTLVLFSYQEQMLPGQMRLPIVVSLMYDVYKCQFIHSLHMLMQALARIWLGL